jgi:plastocyanin
MIRFLAALSLAIVLYVDTASAQHAKTILVEMAGSRFVPETVRANVGDSVVFVNKDTSPHTVTQTLLTWDSGNIATNTAWMLKVDTAGTFHFHCKFSPAMGVSLIVE